MDMNEPLPQGPSLDVDDESEEEQETPLSPDSSPEDKCVGLNPFCLHEQLEAFCSQEFSRRKHFDRRKAYEEFPTLDPSLETAQATTVSRVIEEKKFLGKSKKKARREKKKAEKSKSGSADVVKDPRLLPHRVRTAPRAGSDSSKPNSTPHQNPIMEVSPEEIAALIERLKVVPKRLPDPCNRNEASKFFIPEYDTIFKISYCGHHEAYDDYDLQNVYESFDAFEEKVLGVQEYLMKCFPSLEQNRQLATVASKVQLDELFNLSSSSHKPQCVVPAMERDEDCEPEEDRYLRYQRSLIVKYLRKAKADYLVIEKDQRMKEVEMLKQIGLTSEWQSNSYICSSK